MALRGYWLARSRCRDALGLLLPVLDRPEASADPGLLGAALVTVTCIAPQVDIAPARQYGDQAVELARQLGDDRLLADALGMLSAMHFCAGEPDRGLRLGREAVDRARQLGDDVLLGRSLMICLLSGGLIEPEQSARLLAETIACASRSGNQLLLSYLHNNAAVQALRAGDVLPRPGPPGPGGTSRTGGTVLVRGEPSHRPPQRCAAGHRAPGRRAVQPGLRPGHGPRCRRGAADHPGTVIAACVVFPGSGPPR